MTLESGTALGSYNIVALIGSGGMGEVYRARDTKLGRDVALKILPPLFTRDPERLARFRREAHVLAALNHSHIAQIYGLDEANGIEFLILELVEGETLADRIARGALPLDEALGIARQIGDALAAAHEKGIIHRDLKPANVALTADGQVKVLDFGLAKAVEADQTVATNEVTLQPTMTSPAMTALGVILGTAAYMAPEQAKGRAADKRGDIWAFGCVLFEMLAGRRAFDGDDVTDMLASVLRAEPEWRALPQDLSPTIRLVLTKCLAKDRRERFADITTPLFLLAEPELTVGQSPDSSVRPQHRHRGRALVGAAVAASVLTGLVVWLLRPSPPRPLVARFSVAIPQDQRMSNTGRQEIAVSPDGSMIAYVLNQRLYVRTIGDAIARPIDGTHPGVVTSPVFSPDGQSVAFWAATDRAIERIPIGGGSPATLATDENNPFGLSWSGDHLYIGRGADGVERVPTKGGPADRVVEVKNGERVYGPQLLPDGEHLLFTLSTLSADAGPDAWEKASIVVQSLKTGVRTVILEGASDGRYLRGGTLLYAIGGVVMASPFDARRLAMIGTSLRAIDGVSRSVRGGTAAAQYAVSDSGTLAYVAGPSDKSSGTLLAIFDEARRQDQLLKPISTSVEYREPRVSPSPGRWLAAEVDDAAGANIWIYDLTGATAPRRLTFGGRNRAPMWSADGKHVAFQSDREGDHGIFWQLFDGTGVAERLTRAPSGISHVPESASPDGKRILVTVTEGMTSSLQVLSIADHTLQPFDNVQIHRQVLSASFSPDGTFVAYDGVEGAYVQPFPPTGAQYFVIEGIHPFWTPDGRSLFVSRLTGFTRVPVAEKPAFSFGTPTVEFNDLLEPGPAYERSLDTLPDGRHLVGVSTSQGAGNAGNADSESIDVVLNWVTELDARMGRK